MSSSLLLNLVYCLQIRLKSFAGGAYCHIEKISKINLGIVEVNLTTKMIILFKLVKISLIFYDGKYKL